MVQLKNVFFLYWIQSKVINTHTHTQVFAHKPVNLSLKRGERVCQTLNSLLWFVTSLFNHVILAVTGFKFTKISHSRQISQYITDT